MNYDTISRQAAIDTVMKFMPSLTTPDGCGQFDHEIYAEQEMFVDIGQALNNLPSAERRGRWKKCKKSAFFPDDDIFTCSECFHNYFKQTNYCPNCGARMEW